MQVNLGDKVWMYFGPNTLVVGHLLEQSPDGSFIAVGPCPYEEYSKLTISQKAQTPVSWFDLKYCSYISHIPREQIASQDIKPRAGFSLIE